jgi:hypothetical protein
VIWAVLGVGVALLRCDALETPFDDEVTAAAMIDRPARLPPAVPSTLTLRSLTAGVAEDPSCRSRQQGVANGASVVDRSGTAETPHRMEQASA